MGELWRDEHCHDTTLRRRSVPSHLERAVVDSSLTVVRPATTKTRWSLGGSVGGGRGVPDIVRVSRRYDVAPYCDSHKLSRKDHHQSLSDDVPHKRLWQWQACGHVGTRCSMWNCAGLTWGGLRRRLSVFRRSTRACRGHRQPPAGSIGMTYHRDHRFTVSELERQRMCICTVSAFCIQDFKYGTGCDREMRI